MRALATCENALRSYSTVKLVNLEVPGKSAFLHKSDTPNNTYQLTINCNHPHIRKPYSFNNIYLTLADFFHTSNDYNVSEKFRGVDRSENYLQDCLVQLPFDRKMVVKPNEPKWGIMI